MNSLEVYDFTDRPTTAPTANTVTSEASTSSSASATTSDAPPAQPSLEEEVQQVLGSLGRFWGGVRKQSQTALQTARRDLGGVVEQAQRELGRLSAPAPGSDATTPTESSSTTSTDATITAESSTAPPAGSTEPESGAAPASPSAAPSSFFSRLQSSLPPNLQQTLRTVASTDVQAQFTHRAEELRSQFEVQLHRVQEGVAPTLQRVQDGVAPTLQRVQSELARAQAEAGPRAEALFKDASGFLADAVKVVPPSDAPESHGVAWDGSDIWTPLPEREEVLFDSTSTATAKGKAAAGLTRTEAMLRRIRTDATLYMNDLSEAETSELSKVELAGPIETLDDDLKALLAELVPAQLSEEAFWKRYHFRVHQVEQDDANRRRALEAVAARQDEELFSWDDEDDAPASTSPAPTVKKPTSASEEKREGSESEASYDVVSGAASPTPVPPKEVKEKEKDKKDDEDADSDWE
ncbi:hypothetical protein EXIGLDRAFT_734222 [Exidia glandulosa HHB12029]|uniref:BSD domain-containing protein n=1 Tax=Exidia glandulosa HHB12029 TaxID=1314781 RepID=A0A165K7Z0_EXIGL|nr:hypothetical protein EXIGLDRAFT_734222 [Exidia glandulosa HHB12029]